jgi:hypothetical protein
LVIKALDPDWIRIRIGIQPKMLDPDSDEMNADQQPCFKDKKSHREVTKRQYIFRLMMEGSDPDK